MTHTKLVITLKKTIPFIAAMFGSFFVFFAGKQLLFTGVSAALTWLASGLLIHILSLLLAMQISRYIQLGQAIELAELPPHTIYSVLEVYDGHMKVRSQVKSPTLRLMLPPRTYFVRVMKEQPIFHKFKHHQHGVISPGLPVIRLDRPSLQATDSKGAMK